MRAAANRIRCQSGNQDRMQEALAQFQLYRPTILDALESENLTPELQYLPFVESAFNLAGAVSCGCRRVVANHACHRAYTWPDYQ